MHKKRLLRATWVLVLGATSYGCESTVEDDSTNNGAAGGTGGSGASGATGGVPNTSVTTTSTTGGTGGVGGSGGVGGEAPMAPPFRNPVNLSDADLAAQSLALFGAGEPSEQSDRCVRCHSISRGVIHHWAELTSASVSDCLSDTSVPDKAAAEAIIACVRKKPSNAMSPFSVQKLGINATAADLAWFKYVFDMAYEAEGPVEHTKFKTRAAMPKGDATAFSQADFDIVAEWFARGVPLVDTLLPEDPPVGSCQPSVGPEVATHIDQMHVGGWRSVNDENAILDFGCAGAATTRDCLDFFPLAESTAYGANWTFLSGTKLRILRENPFESSFWTRSSADGRFVAHGGGPGPGSTVIDLVTNGLINVDAAYDPAFFPDNRGFIFQGGGHVCRQSLLASGTTHVTFNEPECADVNQIGLYQHVGAALGGGDYWTVDGQFVSDDGGHNATLHDPNAFFDSGSVVTLTPMLYDGTTFVPKPQINKSVPFEGDTVISPSSRLLVSRRAKQGFGQDGFVLRKLNATPSGNSYTVDVPVVGRYCINGGKPAFSYDERWMVLHHYIGDEDAIDLGFTGPNDPGFAPYRTEGAANIYLVDVLTGHVVRVTHMHPGQYALFPHFRSDGWIYFTMRESDANHEVIVASDAALVQESL